MTEPVGALPAKLRTEHRTLLLQGLVQRAAAHAARRLELLAGPVNCIILAVTFDCAIVQKAMARMQFTETTDIESPQVEAGIAIEYPLCERLAGAAGSGDTGSESAGGEKIGQPRHRAHDRLAVGRDWNRTVDDTAHTQLAENRQAFQRRFEEFLQTFEFAIEQETLILPRKAFPGIDRAGLLFPAADRQRARFGLGVKAAIGITQGRQIQRDTVAFLGHQVLMLNHAGRDFGSRHPAKLARP